METHAAYRGKPGVFVSYGHVDDALPPNIKTDDKTKGFVTYLVSQLGYELQQLGLARGVAWIDRYKLRSGDNFVNMIAEELAKSDILLAVVSYNFLQSDFCRDEISLFSKKITTERNERQRIFRVDKQEVANDSLPDELRNVQAVPFYLRDPESGDISEFYWRGKVNRKRNIEQAIKKLANDIFARLVELNPIVVRMWGGSDLVRRGNQPTKNELLDSSAGVLLSPLRTVFLAKPAFDLQEPYTSFAQELQRSNIAILPHPDVDLPTEGEAALRIVRDALSKTDVSIHLIGERRGFQPEGLSQGIVQMQLCEARAAAAKKPGFQRLIWAPAIVPGSDNRPVQRDPNDVVAQLDQQLEHDEIVGDTSARFTDFLRQRLLPQTQSAAHQTQKPSTVYVSAAPADKQCAIDAAKALKALGARPTPVPNTEFKGARSFDSIMLCWGTADTADVLAALDAASRELTVKKGNSGKLCLLVCAPASDAKQLAIEVESFGAADLIIDATQLPRYTSLSQLFGEKG